MTAREIADLVPMPQLLDVLGFAVNERTHRARCVLHGGKNPTSFSWRDDGRWRCFVENIRGDRIALVQRVRGRGFKDAMRLLAALSGVKWRDSTLGRARLAKERRERQRLEAEALASLKAERVLRLEAAEHVRALERLQERAGKRLKALMEGVPERLVGETEALWSALEFVAKHLDTSLAQYQLLAYGAEKDRFDFLSNSHRRAELIDRALLGGLADDSGGPLEVTW